VKFVNSQRQGVNHRFQQLTHNTQTHITIC